MFIIKHVLCLCVIKREDNAVVLSITDRVNKAPNRRALSSQTTPNLLLLYYHVWLTCPIRLTAFVLISQHRWIFGYMFSFPSHVPIQFLFCIVFSPIGQPGHRDQP